jgi:hypothetical protein
MKTKSRTVKWMGHVECMREERKVYKLLMGKFKGKNPLKRPRHRWENRIKMDLRDINWEDVEWIHLDQDRDKWQALVSTMKNLRILVSQGWLVS